MSTVESELDRSAYEGFEGEVGRTFAESSPHWDTRPQPPPKAPNVVIVLADDMGYSDLGCFGSEIETPNLDALAREGRQFTNFHVTPLCSPTRAALLTGMNHHEAGVGYVTRDDMGFPGYRSAIAEDALTAAEVFRSNGYSTFAVGKWHLIPDPDLSSAGDKSSWPLQRGFDKFFGFMWGFSNLHQPYQLHRDNHEIEIDTYPEDYYLTDDLTDQALAMIRDVKSADPVKPFFLYLAQGAVHAPLMAKPDDIAKYRGRYDAGWDRLRDDRFARQRELGVVPAAAVLPERAQEEGYEVPAWDSLTTDQQELMARHMEVFAGMVDNVDQNIGRLRAGLEELGEWDNTIFVFLSDNGGSREGGSLGTSDYYRTVRIVHTGGDSVQEELDRGRMDLLGGPQVMGHYPWSWASVSNTPFRLYKNTTFSGGHQVPFLMSWPSGLNSDNPIRRQYCHVRDLLPTLIDQIGLDVPAQRGSRAARPMSGTSFANALREADADGRSEQYYEMSGHRGMYRNGWHAVSLAYRGRGFRYDHDKWQLFDLTTDPTETNDLSQSRPEVLEEMIRAFDEAAWKNQVYPLHDGGLITNRPPRDPSATSIRLTPRHHTMDPVRSRIMLHGRVCSFTVDFDYAAGDEGVLFTHGDQGGGYGLYVRSGSYCFVLNSGRSLERLPGPDVTVGQNTVTVTLDSRAAGQVALSLIVDDSALDLGTFPMFGELLPLEGVNVGRDRRSPVDWEAYLEHGVFAYGSTIRSVLMQAEAMSPASASRVASNAAAAASRVQ